MPSEDAGSRISLLASAVRTASGNGSAVPIGGSVKKLAAQIVVSAASGTSPTLDAKIQHSIDGGTTWFDLITFAQKTTTGNELKSYAEVEASTAQVIGDTVRVVWTI